jgi:hypothetical protein
VASLLGSYGLSRTSYSTLAFGIAWTIGALFLGVVRIWPIAASQAILALLAFRRYWRRKHDVNVPRTNHRAEATGVALGEDRRRTDVEQDRSTPQ